MELLINAQGKIRAIYGETIDLRTLGRISIQRASHVEPTPDGDWISDLGPVAGPCLGPFASRSEALAAELTWLGEYWLSRAPLSV
jgi:hypothetical protein